MLAQRFRIAFTTAVLLLALPAFSREKVTVAVLDFEPKNITAESAEAATDLLRTELFNTGCFKVVERQRIQKILEEQRFQSTGVTDTDQAAEIGRLLNVQKIMIGTVTLLGGTHILNTRIVDVQSGQVELAEAVESRGGEENLPRAVTELALKISYKIGLEGHVIRITGETVYIDLGAADGVQVGQIFDVIREGEVITDLEGRTIGAQSEAIATVMITKVQDRFSETAVHSQTTSVQKGDRILPESEKKEPPVRRPAVKEKPKTNRIPDDSDTVEMPALF